jgi:hypothetical protein
MDANASFTSRNLFKAYFEKAQKIARKNEEIPHFWESILRNFIIYDEYYISLIPS